MKVLRAPPKFSPIELRCKCGAVLEAELSDFKRNVGGDQRDYWDYAEATCPCCQDKITVGKDRFPFHIYEGLPRAKNGW